MKLTKVIPIILITLLVSSGCISSNEETTEPYDGNYYEYSVSVGVKEYPETRNNLSNVKVTVRLEASCEGYPVEYSGISRSNGSAIFVEKEAKSDKSVTVTLVKCELNGWKLCEFNEIGSTWNISPWAGNSISIKMHRQ